MTTNQEIDALKDIEKQITLADAEIESLKGKLKTSRDEREGLVSALLSRIRGINDKQIEAEFAEAEVEDGAPRALPAHEPLAIPENRDAA